MKNIKHYLLAGLISISFAKSVEAQRSKPAKKSEREMEQRRKDAVSNQHVKEMADVIQDLYERISRKIEGGGQTSKIILQFFSPTYKNRLLKMLKNPESRQIKSEGSEKVLMDLLNEIARVQGITNQKLTEMKERVAAKREREKEQAKNNQNKVETETKRIIENYYESISRNLKGGGQVVDTILQIFLPTNRHKLLKILGDSEQVSFEFLLKIAKIQGVSEKELIQAHTKALAYQEKEREKEQAKNNQNKVETETKRIIENYYESISRNLKGGGQVVDTILQIFLPTNRHKLLKILGDSEQGSFEFLLKIAKIQGVSEKELIQAHTKALAYQEKEREKEQAKNNQNVEAETKRIVEERKKSMENPESTSKKKIEDATNFYYKTILRADKSHDPYFTKILSTIRSEIQDMVTRDSEFQTIKFENAYHILKLLTYKKYKKSKEVHVTINEKAWLDKLTNPILERLFKLAKLKSYSKFRKNPNQKPTNDYEIFWQALLSGKITGDNRYISIDTYNGISEYAKVIQINKKLFGRNTLLLAMDTSMHESRNLVFPYKDSIHEMKITPKNISLIRVNKKSISQFEYIDKIVELHNAGEIDGKFVRMSTAIMPKSHKDSLAFLDPAQIFQTSGRKLKIVRFDHGELLIEPKVLELGLVRLMGKKETDLENLAYENLYNFQAKYNAGEIREYQAVLIDTWEKTNWRKRIKKLPLGNVTQLNEHEQVIRYVLEIKDGVATLTNQPHYDREFGYPKKKSTIKKDEFHHIQVYMGEQPAWKKEDWEVLSPQ